MKAMVLLALILLPLVSQADVVIPENEKQSRPPVKTDTTVTATTTASTTASSATQTTASKSPAPAPERRRSTFPFAALFTIGIALIAALSAKRRRAQKAQ